MIVVDAEGHIIDEEQCVTCFVGLKLNLVRLGRCWGLRGSRFVDGNCTF